MPNNSIFKRAKSLLSLKEYSSATLASPHLLSLNPCLDLKSQAPQDQYILRMLIKSPLTNGFAIPPELEWATPLIHQCHLHHATHFPEQFFWYVTVRNGVVSSQSDDVWHVDGFSLRTPHVPQQNYILTTAYGTQVLDQHIDIPQDFDASKHNLHMYLQSVAKEENTKTLPVDMVHCIDPYVVHRRDPKSFGQYRKFIRLSAIPIEIEDDTCMQNPLLPAKVYGRKDIRLNLVDYFTGKGLNGKLY